MHRRYSSIGAFNCACVSLVTFRVFYPTRHAQVAPQWNSDVVIQQHQVKLDVAAKKLPASSLSFSLKSFQVIALQIFSCFFSRGRAFELP
jgi:hypothetical protein